MTRSLSVVCAIGLFVLSLCNAGSIEWQQVTPKPTSYNFVASYSFNDTDIFTTGHSAIESSDYTGGILVRNGMNWEYTSCAPSPVITIESLAYIPHLGKILGVGGGTVVTFDPKNISSGCSVSAMGGAYRLYNIAAGNGIILAMNIDFSILFQSTTGIYWTEIKSVPFQEYSNLLFDTTYNRFALTSKNGTFVSVNGKNWIKLQSNNDSLAFSSFTMFANKFVALSYARRVYISDNNNSTLYWRDISPNNASITDWFYFAAQTGSTIFVAKRGISSFNGEFNTTVWSTDDFGSTWQIVWHKNNSFVPKTILRSGNEWLIGGEGGKLISTSDWSTFNSVFPAYALTTETLNDVTFLNGRFILSGSNALYQSVDGYSWDKIDNNGFYSVTYSPISNLFVGIPYGVAFTSPDLKNWTRATIQQDNPGRLYFSHRPVVTKEGYLLVSGQIGSVWYGTGFWLSQDGGLTWSKLPLKFGSATCGEYLATIGYANNTVHISCPGPYPVTMSTNNITSNNWKRENENYYMFLTGGSGSAQNTIVALRDSYSNGGLYLLANGKWILTQKFADPNSNSYDPLPRNQLFVNGKFWSLYRSGLAFSSADGQSWTQEAINMYGIRTMTYGNGRYVAVGDHGIILVGKENN